MNESVAKMKMKTRNITDCMAVPFRNETTAAAPYPLWEISIRKICKHKSAFLSFVRRKCLCGCSRLLFILFHHSTKLIHQPLGYLLYTELMHSFYSYQENSYQMYWTCFAFLFFFCWSFFSFHFIFRWILGFALRFRIVCVVTENYGKKRNPFNGIRLCSVLSSVQLNEGKRFGFHWSLDQMGLRKAIHSHNKSPKCVHRKTCSDAFYFALFISSFDQLKQPHASAEQMLSFFLYFHIVVPIACMHFISFIHATAQMLMYQFHSAALLASASHYSCCFVLFSFVSSCEWFKRAAWCSKFHSFWHFFSLYRT